MRRMAWLVMLTMLLAAVVGTYGQEPQYGGTLVIGMGTDIARWDIHNCSGMQNLGIQRLVTELLTDHHWETGELLPWLAKSWEVSPDATTWTIHLEEGIRFHDTTPFNAKAVKFNLERLLEIPIPLRLFVSSRHVLVSLLLVAGDAGFIQVEFQLALQAQQGDGIILANRLGRIKFVFAT